MVPNQKVNSVLISCFKSFNKFNEKSQLLENPNGYIKQLGRKSIKDYNYEYFTFRKKKNVKNE